MDSSALTSRPLLFANNSFLLVGFPPLSEESLSSLIRFHGGTVGTFLGENVTYIVCHSDVNLAERLDLQVTSTTHPETPLVNETFIYESSFFGSKQPAKNFPVVKIEETKLDNVYPLKIDECKLFAESLFPNLSLPSPETTSKTGMEITHFHSLPPPSVTKLIQTIQNNDSEIENSNEFSIDKGNFISQTTGKLILNNLKSNIFRLKMLEFLSYLIELNYDVIDDLILHNGILSAIFDLYFARPYENVMHGIVTRIFIEIFQNHHLKLQEYLLNEKSFIEEIIKGTENEFIRPHFVQIFNVLENISKIRKNLEKKIKNSDEKKIFFEETLAKINERNSNEKWKIIEKGHEVVTMPKVDLAEFPLLISAPPPKFFVCSKCKAEINEEPIRCQYCGICYCSTKCLLLHWRGGHKQECNKTSS